MRLEVHTFDPELLTRMMEKDPVPEGLVATISSEASLRYERTFSRRVKEFPRILHFAVDVASEEGACHVVEWFLERTSGRSVEKVVVEYQDVRMDVQEMKRLLCCGSTL